jgi:hypothetical protein
MADIKLNNLDGIPFGDNAGRPTAATGQPYFNGEASRLELYSLNAGWQNVVAETPSVESVSGNFLETNTTNTLTIFGKSFVEGAVVEIIGTNGAAINAGSVTFNSAVQLTASFGAISVANEPYDVKVTNPSNLFGLLPDALYINDKPVWSTAAGLLLTANEGEVVSLQLSSTDAENTSRVYSLVSGSLPAGLSISSSGLISGTISEISASTTYNFVLGISDSANTVQQRSFSITVNNLPPVWSTSSTLPTLTKDTAYSTTIVATDANAVTYTIQSGSLTAGLSLNSASGLISGTPSAGLISTFTVRATNPGGQFADRAFTIPNPGPVWITSSVPGAVRGIAYSQQLNVTEDGTKTFSITSGSLPSGISLSSSGLISGTSTTVTASTNITFRVTDDNGQIADRVIAFSVADQPTGGTLYQSVGSFTFTVPSNVFQVSVVAIGGGGGGGSGNSGGGGGGGGLAWRTFSVTPGSTASVAVGGGGSGSSNGQNVDGGAGGTSQFVYAGTGAYGYGGGGGNSSLAIAGGGGSYSGSGGGNGGSGGSDYNGSSNRNTTGPGGGGAGGYSGNGGAGAEGGNLPGGAGSGGGAGGGASSGTESGGGAGGGTGVYGQGASGSAGANPGGGGGGGSGGGAGNTGNSVSFGANGGSYGGGGGGTNDSHGGGFGNAGAVRVIWGYDRSFPSTNTGQNYNGVGETVI